MLLGVARRAIEQGLRQGKPEPVQLADYPPALREPRGCFVTLRRGGQLRGCLGSLEARGPLVQEIARLAYAAATRDPRFDAMTTAELIDLEIKLSVLSVPERLAVSSEAELLAILRPGIDGVILSDGPQLGTFLPEVWDNFTSAQAFLDQLRAKAGLPPGHWSETTVAERYTTQSF